MTWLLMSLEALTPVLLSMVFYLLDTKTKFGKRPLRQRQILIGIAFGVLACLDSQFGIQYDGYLMNVRSAAPLSAGLIFGGPAGIIAGTMGALFRWFCVYWLPRSTYTRVACTVATLLAGLIATVCRKYMFDDKKSSWFYGLFIAMSTEVFHMLLVFFTHMDDIQRAFEVVKQTAIPMIVANGLSVLATLLFVTAVSKEGFRQKKNSRPMTQTFAIYLLLCVVAAFVATISFNYVLQNNVSELQVNQLLTMNVQDVEADIADTLDRDLMERTENIERKIKTNPNFTVRFWNIGFQQALIQLKNTYNVSEINVIDNNGVIVASTNSLYEGYNLYANPNGQGAEFMQHFAEGEESYVQEYLPMDFHPEEGDTEQVWRKYAGVKIDDDYIVQVGYDKTRFESTLHTFLKDIAANRHIGQTGFLFILDPAAASPLVSAPKDTVTDDSLTGFVETLSDLEDEVVQYYQVPNGESYYFVKDTAEGYVIIGCIPESEAIFSRDISVYIGVFMQLVVFFVLFLLVFFLLKYSVVDNIRKINLSLAKITDGDLSTRVDVQANEEFASLSNDINTTVSRLKDYIDEAERRIDRELAFAKAIQHSALPSVFPPFPDRDDFDIFASMDTAKEVGGDFYDFAMLPGNRLFFLIADVSGKGIPAAMFMMTAKTLLKSLAESGLSCADILTAANDKLCENNEAGMFVTVWIGILDLNSGVLTYASAGHNPPALRQKDGEFALLKSKAGLVLAGMEGIRYKEIQLTLQAGDVLYLYTDGVTEATDAATTLFGEDRLLATLKEAGTVDAKGYCEAVTAAVDAFVGAADQFDDITMLSLVYRPVKGKELTVDATVENIETVTSFVEETLEPYEPSMKASMQINVAIDELFGNIAHYAYAPGSGRAKVAVLVDNDTAHITFTDSGKPFDPLEKADPDTTLSAEERGIGGLGIFMVKKTMDDVAYVYKDGQNILKISKKLH